MPEKKETATEKERFVLVEVPTQHELAIKDNETDEVYNLFNAVCKLMNDVAIIRKTL